MLLSTMEERESEMSTGLWQVSTTVVSTTEERVRSREVSVVTVDNGGEERVSDRESDSERGGNEGLNKKNFP